ncbi:LOW QUALITY PROTEIN: kinesin-like protein KIF27 [Pecten maximus]|uniref:LOW QUALITY PROTEIN: kinesin-like protein KIF27 n=1 Tax=Pecten maximus TaxID=6579 RepID=UPI0014589DEE|nr:LOW QUALITY PROTEIN: kinesin-like protein KIF27 [Pecten maximus]
MAEVNVRVAVRVRPLLPKEKIAGEEICVRVLPNTKQVVVGKDRAFTFDYVLSSKTAQDDVYKSCVESLVKSTFDGYNATVFAYGQTGSGKTFTIGGGNISCEEEYGIIPRALKEIFDTIEVNIKKTKKFLVKVSYIEIYKEELQDLLDTETSYKDLHVREDDKGNTVIIGAREVDCESLDDVMTLLEAGTAVRQTGSTQMNEQSSRSHSIFTVVIEQKWTEADVMAGKRKPSESSEVVDEAINLPQDITHCMSGKFHFVDLAGSERAHRTGNVGDRFKESVHINSGLLALGNVISALGDPKKKSSHIPYRESKITRLLKDSLGGNAQTLMVCCISPATANFDESLNALKYANRARNIKNKPIVNRDVQALRFEEMQCEIKALREELVRQRTSILSNGGAGDMVNAERAIQDAANMKHMEDQVSRLQTECSHYKMIADEAYKQLLEIQDRDILSQSQDFRLKDWLDLMEEIKNKVPTTLTREEVENETIRDLQTQLSKCKEDLKSDEEIFAEKSRDHSQMMDRLEEFETVLEQRDQALIDADERIKQQQQQLLEQQMKIEELQRALKTEDTFLSESSILDDDAVSASAPPAPLSSRRPKSVPAHVHRRPDTTNSGLRPPSRNIKTSPALFTLERVMKSFRARSQLLVSRLEDSDEVLHPDFGEEQEKDNPRTASVAGSRLTRRGTFKVGKQKKTEENKENNASSVNIPEIRFSRPDSARSSLSSSAGDLDFLKQSEDLRKSTNTQRQIKESQLKMIESQQKMRDLSINIKMKEQLIRELVKTGKDSESMNKQYAEKIRALEKEKEKVKSDLAETQKVLSDIEVKGQQESSEKQRLQSEYRKKIESAKARITTLHKRQKDTEKIANFTLQNDKKIQDLELNVDRMKQQQETLNKRLKEETERKSKLERDMQKEVHRVKELQLKNEQQQKILKRKNEEIAAAQRKLRSGSLPPINIEDHDKIEEQKRWLDNEVEKVVEQRRQMEVLQEELKKREAIISKKEYMLAEKSELEMKRLRSSQVINKNILTVSTKLNSVDKKLEEKSKELAQTPEEHQAQVKDEIQTLSDSREKLNKQRLVLEKKLQDGRILSGPEERRMIELDEAIDALDAAIDYKNENINSRQLEIRHSQMLSQSEDNMINRLNSLSTTETRTLLSRYFDKVISLRETERKINLHNSEQEVKIDEQERLIRELESSLQRSQVDIDRRLTKQQKEYEQKIQLLMRQITEMGGSGSGHQSDNLEAKYQQLEKELYYYKKTSRDLKRKLREIHASGALGDDHMSLHGSVQSSMGDIDSQVNHSQSHHRNTDNGSHSHQGEKSSSRPNSARSASHIPANATPVKISRKDLRLMSETEVKLRRSNLSHSGSSQQLRDSLDSNADNNPWS